MKNIFGTPPLPDMAGQNPIAQPMDMGIQTAPTPYEDIQFDTPQPATDTPIPTVQPNPIQPPVNQPANGGLSNIAQKMAEMYTPESEASDRYNKMISDYPNREDTKPGFWRSLGSAIIDYTKGPQRGQAFYDQPFQDKLIDWKNKIGPAGTAANLERNQNVNERTMSYQTASNILRQNAQDEKAKMDEANIKIRQQRADVYDWKAKHPNMKMVFPKGGNIQAVDPTSGKVIDLGIPTGTLTDADKYDLQQENAIARIDESGNQARQTEGVRQGGREAIAETRGWQIYNVPDPANPGQSKAVKINAITGEVKDIAGVSGPMSKPSSTGNKPETPRQKRDREYNAASQLKNTDSELGQFIKIGSPGSNDFEITQPSDPTFFGYQRGHKGPTPDQAKRINDIVYGSSAMSPVASHNTPTTSTIPKGRVAVQDKKGNKFTVPAEQLQQAISQGYTEIR